jgi:hypothetical protein
MEWIASSRRNDQGITVVPRHEVIKSAAVHILAVPIQKMLEYFGLIQNKINTSELTNQLTDFPNTSFKSIDMVNCFYKKDFDYILPLLGHSSCAVEIFSL